MANISINGANYTDVPRIDVPKTGGGGNASFYETSSDTATAADIAYGKTAHGASGLITGEATPSTPVLQDKTVKSTTSIQTVTADSGYDGLGTITVSPMNLGGKWVTPSQQIQVIEPIGGSDGFSTIYVGKAELQDKTVSPSTSQQVITADSDKYGLGQVTVNAMNLQTKQVTPTSSQQVITADSGYDGLEEVIVDASSGGSSAVLQPTKSVTPKKETYTVQPDAGYDAMEEVVVAPDQLLQMATKTTSDVGTVENAQLIDFEEGYDSAGSFYGWGQYFRNTAEDTGMSAADSVLGNPKYCKVKLPKNITTVGARAFCAMAGLTEVIADLENTVTVGSGAFAYTPNLSTVGNLWSKITTVTSNSFRALRQGNGSNSIFERNNDIECPLLTTVTGSTNTYAFSRSAFKSFKAPLLTGLPSYTFYNCYYLQTADFTALTSIGSSAFAGCASLTDIYLRGNNVVTLASINAFSGLISSNITVHVPSSLVSSYQNDTNWGASGVNIVAI